MFRKEQKEPVADCNERKRNLADGIAFFLTLAIVIPLTWYVISSPFSDGAAAYVVSGKSMLPTLTDSQTVIATPREAYTVGEIVVSLLPEEGLRYTSVQEDQYIVKRVVACPGDTVEIGSDDEIRVNGAVLEEPYLSPEAKAETYLENYHTRYELGEGEYFLLGDNRGNSCDSRHFGAVTREEISGAVDESVNGSTFLLVSAGKNILLVLGVYWLSDKLLTALLRKLFLGTARMTEGECPIV